jgi:uncharacterized membrane protein YphA (DoxX/SURF4 family)
MVLPEWLYDWMHLGGRLLFGLLFLTSGLSHLIQLDSMAGYAQSKGLPAARAMTVITGLMIVAGSVMVILGWHRFIGAGLVFVFLLGTATMMHAYWRETDPTAKANEVAHFWKDLALAGAALFMAHYARYTWPFSLGG